MEIANKITFFDQMKNLAFKEKYYFLTRREINWSSLGKCAALALALGLIGILLIPAPMEAPQSFTEQSQLGEKPRLEASDPTQETLQQISQGSFSRTAPVHLSNLYLSSPAGGRNGVSDSKNSSMILGRGSLDTRTQIPAGSRIAVRLIEKAIVASQGMPVMGVITQNYVYDDSVAVPQGSRILGDISFDNSGERASMTWRSVQLPDGRERPLSAIGVGLDGQIGVEGRVHSELVKNVVGQTMIRFLGAYAAGSMQRGSFGQNPGGAENGFKNAISETAQDQAERWANDLRQEKRWIEISNRTEFYAVLTENFAFRDPGATYGE